MCGRISQKNSRSEFKNYVYGFDPEEDLNRPNIKPTQPVQIVVNIQGETVVVPARWWFQKENAASFSTKYTTFNARSDKIGSSFLYKKAIERKRCLVPVSSFYEWKEKGKPPCEIFLAKKHPFALAGLWSSYSEDRQPKNSFTIITCDPNEFMSTIHNRMPVVLDSIETQRGWLDDGNMTLLGPFSGELASVQLEMPLERLYPNQIAS